MTGMATSGSTGTGGLGGSGGGGKKDGDKKDDKKEYKNGNPMGLLKKPAKPRAPKMKWTLEKDYKLLLIAMCKELSGKDYEKIAADFEEKPTKKAIQERYTKLRVLQKAELARINLGEPDAELPIVPGSPEAEEESVPAVVAPGVSTYGMDDATVDAEAARQQEAAQALILLQAAQEKDERPRKRVRKSKKGGKEE